MQKVTHPFLRHHLGPDPWLLHVQRLPRNDLCMLASGEKLWPARLRLASQGSDDSPVILESVNFSVLGSPSCFHT